MSQNEFEWWFLGCATHLAAGVVHELTHLASDERDEHGQVGDGQRGVGLDSWPCRHKYTTSDDFGLRLLGSNINYNRSRCRMKV